jgi:glycosyltransferase involved in cell wall biosynthesis
LKEHILIIGKVWPEPSSSAAGSRTLQLINLFLEQNWQVSFASAASESDYSFDLKSLGISTLHIVLNDSSFDDLVKNMQPHMVLFDRFTSEEQFGWRVAQNCPNALRILDTIDLHCLRLARQEAIKQNRDFSLLDFNSDFAKREIASIYRSDVSLMISDYEMDLLINHFKIDNSLLHYVPFLLDPILIKNNQWPSFSEREHFLSIGNFLHEPNWDAVLFLKQFIWPLIRKQLPKAEIHIYGAYPSKKVFDLNNLKEGFLIKGRADSLESVMKKTKVCLAPLRFGAGIKGKLIDAMQFRVPSVTTDIGAEAMHGEFPWNGIIANQPHKFAEAAVELYTNEIKWQQAVENGAQILNNFFLKSNHSDLLIDKLLFLKNQLKSHRSSNFIGEMLMHHTVMGTKYMSLWIEAKNKLK